MNNKTTKKLDVIDDNAFKTLSNMAILRYDKDESNETIENYRNELEVIKNEIDEYIAGNVDADDYESIRKLEILHSIVNGYICMVNWVLSIR